MNKHHKNYNYISIAKAAKGVNKNTNNYIDENSIKNMRACLS